MNKFLKGSLIVFLILLWETCLLKLLFMSFGIILMVGPMTFLGIFLSLLIMISWTCLAIVPASLLGLI